MEYRVRGYAAQRLREKREILDAKRYAKRESKNPSTGAHRIQMVRVFVDVDDTLVRWAPETRGVIHPYGKGADDWEPNCDVIHLLRALKAEGAEITVWSGGGEEWADYWADKLIPNLYDNAMDKYPRIPSQGEVYIDDLDSEGDYYPWQRLAIHPLDLRRSDNE